MLRRTILFTTATVLCDVASSADAPPKGGALALSAEQLQSIAGPIISQVQATVTQSVTELRDENKKLTARIEELSKPIQQSGWLRGAPAIRNGEDPLSSRPYRFQNLMGMRTGFWGEERCKVEVDVSNRLKKFYVQQGGMALENERSYLMPFGTGMLAGMPEEDTQFIQQSMEASISGFDPDAFMHLMMRQGLSQRQALSQFDDAGLGVFLGPTAKGELIELVRAKELFSRAGARQMTLPPNGRLTFDRHTGATTAYWVGEVPSNRSTPTITPSEPTTGSLNLLAKKLACLVKCPNDLLRFATPEVEAFIRSDMARTMALLADLTALEGIGSTNSPKGLINYNIVPYTAGTVATDGNTFEPEDVALMKAELEERNHDTESGSFAWCMRPKMWSNLTNRRAAAHTAGTYDGGWLFPTNRGDMGKRVAPMLDGDMVIKSTQISKTRTKGSSTDLSYILAGLFEHFLIARVGVLEFATTNMGDTPFTTDQTWMRCIQHMDCGPRYEDAFVICDSLDMDLPA